MKMLLSIISTLAHAWSWDEVQAVCKVCRKDVTDNAKERRPLSSKQFNTLFTLATASSPSPPASLVHSFLARSPNYVCKSCYSVLTKYGSVAKEVEAMQHCVKGVFAQTHSTGSASASAVVSYWIGMNKRSTKNVD